MTQGWKRIMATVAALALMLSLLPTQMLTREAQAAGTYGKTTATVRVRKKPSTSEEYWFKLEAGFVCTIKETVTSEGKNWYKVDTHHPDPNKDRTYIGYIQADFFTPLTADETAAWEKNPVQGQWNGTVSTPTDTTGSGGSSGSAPDADTTPPASSSMLMGQINAGGVNFRYTEGGKVISRLDRGTKVEILSTPSVIDDKHWYRVRYDGREGYIQAPFITVTGNVTVTPPPNISDGGNYGYVRLILSSANLRLTPGGKIDAQWERKGEMLPVRGPAISEGGYYWYPITFGGNGYYVRHDCVEYVQSDGSVSGTPETVTPPPVTAASYLITVKAGVNLRLQPSGNSVTQLKRGVVVTQLSQPVASGGYNWYLVQVDQIRGYVRSDCVQPCSQTGGPTTPVAQPTAPVTNAPSSYGYVKTTTTNVNLRAKPAGSSQTQLDKGVVLPLLSNPVRSGKYDWYHVRTASGLTGYLRGDCVTQCNAAGGAPDTTLPPATDVTNAPSLSKYGYAMIKSDNVNVRKSPSGDSIGRVHKNTVWQMTGNSVTYKGYTWYPITTGTLSGYVRGDHSFKLSAEQERSYLAGNGVPGGSDGIVTPPTTTVMYVQTVEDSVNLRASASKDAASVGMVPKATVLAYNAQNTVGGSLWYRVVYNNTEVWVLGSCVKVMTDAEYQAYLASKPANTPQKEVILGYVKTTTGGVNLRTTANGANILGRIDKGVVMPYTREPVTAGRYTWYYVSTSLGYGYLRGDCVTVCDANGGAAPLPSKPIVTTGPGSGQEASYTTLRRGSKGDAVKNLTTELKIQGFYTGSITSSYTSAVESAVKAFQQAKGLEVDGIAGSKTQHALYGTVPIGSGNVNNLDMVLYQAEKIDWYTGGIQTLWAKGANYKVYDVKTGIVWWAHRWAGGSHADVEPLTAADSARLCKIYGVSDPDDIAKKNMWQRRPCLVTIGTRTFACSLYGVPHNYPDGDTIATNNFKGQVCIHFTNSKTHGGNKVDSYHAEAIDYAWKNAPNGYK